MSQMQERYPNLKRGSGRGRLSTAATRAKTCYLEVFEKLGGASGLLAWVQSDPENKKLFYGWIVKLLPKELDVTAHNEEPFSPRDLAVRAARAIIESEVIELTALERQSDNTLGQRKPLPVPPTLKNTSTAHGPSGTSARGFADRTGVQDAEPFFDDEIPWN